MKKARFLTIRIFLILATLVLGLTNATSCSFSYRGIADFRPGPFASNGERIYFTAESSSGTPIRYSGGVTMMMNSRNTCADCHGADGKGGRITMMMMSSFQTPDITWDNLTEAELEGGHGGDEEEHQEHPPYTEETLKSAITEGVNPAGESLDEEMPRWQMSELDLNDLVEFIKTLE